MAFRTGDGTTLWHESVGRVQNGPIMFDLPVGGGSSLYAYALP